MVYAILHGCWKPLANRSKSPILFDFSRKNIKYIFRGRLKV